MTAGLLFSLAAIVIAAATILRIRCVERRMDAEYARKARIAIAEWKRLSEDRE